MMRIKRKWALATVLVFIALAGLAVFWHEYGKPIYPIHRHCMKGAGLALRVYANDHDGRFPYHTNGFGDALLLLVKEYSLTVELLTGPGDDGEIFSQALERGGDVPEEKCSRIYIQGLSHENSPNIAILFDRYATRGGDHAPFRWRPYLREVCLLDGSMQVIEQKHWKEFVRQQIDLLVEEGLRRETALAYYRMAED